MTLSFWSVDGTAWPLDGSTHVTALQDIGGFYTPSVDLTVDARVGADGGVLVSSRQPPRPIDLPVMVSTTRPAVRSVWSAFLSSVAAGGTLVNAGDTSTRQLRQISLQSVTSGLLGYNLEHVDDEVFTLSLLALDPWWYSEAVVVPLAVAGDSIPWNSANDWSSPLPWNGGSSMSLTVAGSATAFPVFDIYGPATEVSVGISSGTGWATQAGQTLAAGQRLTVDHRPGRRGPKLAGATTINWALLSEDSRLFAMPPGNHTLVMNVAGDTSATRATMTYEPRWFTP